MNFLAHLALANNNKPFIIGNFIADQIKGRKIFDYPDEIRKGIIHHRFIDEFTDTNFHVIEGKKILRGKYDKYSGIILDVFFDHLLIKHWSEFYPNNHKEFIKAMYLLLQQNKLSMPDSSIMILENMVKYNWLEGYESIHGIDRALTGLSRRTKFESKMELASKDLILNFNDLEELFLQFYPDLKINSDQKLISLIHE